MIIGPQGQTTTVAAATAATNAAAAVAASPAPAGAALYPGTTIIASTEDTGPDAVGDYVNGRTVTFQVPTGDIGSVWIPYSTLTAANVAAAVNAVASQIAELYLLNNPTS